MIAFLIFIIIVLASVVVIFLFAPQKLPWFRPHLLLERSEIKSMEPRMVRQPVITEGLGHEEPELEISLNEKIQRLEMILNEKNKNLEKVQKELNAEKTHRREFERVKSMLEEEIQILKTRNKELKMNIGEKHG